MSIKDVFINHLKGHAPAKELFDNLNQCGNIYLIGGVLREYLDHHNFQSLRDIDIIVDVQDYEHWDQTMERFRTQSNCFGGNKIYCGGLLIDVWSINQTWAYREKIISCLPEQYVSKLSETVFLNIDGIIYDWKRNKWFDEKYREAIDRRTLDVVLKDNPQIPLNIVRAFILKKRYDLSFSEELVEIINKESLKYADLAEFACTLEQVQLNRYHKFFYTANELLKELHNL